MLDVVMLNQFKKDLKLMKKRGLNEKLLSEVVNLLRQQVPLDAKYRDHALTGDYRGCRECHIQPDWLLIYKIDKENLVLLLIETGSHSDLF